MLRGKISIYAINLPCVPWLSLFIPEFLVRLLPTCSGDCDADLDEANSSLDPVAVWRPLSSDLLTFVSAFLLFCSFEPVDLEFPLAAATVHLFIYQVFNLSELSFKLTALLTAARLQLHLKKLFSQLFLILLIYSIRLMNSR